LSDLTSAGEELRASVVGSSAKLLAWSSWQSKVETRSDWNLNALLEDKLANHFSQRSAAGGWHLSQRGELSLSETDENGNGCLSSDENVGISQIRLALWNETRVQWCTSGLWWRGGWNTCLGKDASHEGQNYNENEVVLAIQSPTRKK